MEHWRNRSSRAMRTLARVFVDPCDTAAGAKMVGSLTGTSQNRLFSRFARDPSGAPILLGTRRPEGTLKDRGALGPLKPERLGHANFAWTRDEELCAEGLLDITADAPLGAEHLTDDQEVFMVREKFAHTRLHARRVSARDLPGEAALLHMMFIQITNPILVLPSFLSSNVHSFSPQGARAIREARRKAHSAAWLPAQDWEDGLRDPLAELQRTPKLRCLTAFEPVVERGFVAKTFAAETSP